MYRIIISCIQGNWLIILIGVYFRRLKIKHDSHEFILESGTVANNTGVRWTTVPVSRVYWSMVYNSSSEQVSRCTSTQQFSWTGVLVHSYTGVLVTGVQMYRYTAVLDEQVYRCSVVPCSSIQVWRIALCAGVQVYRFLGALQKCTGVHCTAILVLVKATEYRSGCVRFTKIFILGLDYHIFSIL
jgi:hypothetical protein